jgi:mono/diheme cytochrome c family protein
VIGGVSGSAYRQSGLCLLAIMLAAVLTPFAAHRLLARFDHRHPADEAVTPERPRLGVTARIIAGAVTVERTLPLASFSLEDGQSLDPRLPPGPFEAEFVLTIDAGDVEYARVGARLENASLIVFDRGSPVLSTAAGATPAARLTTEPVFVAGSRRRLTYLIASERAGPVRFRALWQPEGSPDAIPLSARGAPVIDGPPRRGERLVRRLSCAACHASGDAARQASLDDLAPPRLERIGARARPAWLRAWLAQPDALAAGTAMPALFDDSAPDRAAIEDLTHLLASLGGPFREDAGLSDPALAREGMVAFHRVGCFACHGALESPGAVPGVAAEGAPARSWRRNASLGEPAVKTSVDELARFLLDPRETRPRGSMPAMALSDREARAIAA